MTVVRELRSSLALFTALPVARDSSRPLKNAAAGLPLVGLVLGGVLVAIDAGVSLLLPVEAAPALVVVALAVLTGALHLDGLADTMDGLMGGRDREQRLAIMDDPRNGAFGFSAIAAVLVLKWAALIPLEGDLRVGALLVAPVLARSAALVALQVFPLAKPAGLGATARSGLNTPTSFLSLGLALLFAALVFWPTGLVLVLAAGVVVALVGGYALARIGGITGDVLGAVVEITEVTILLLAATAVEHAWLT
jgi:adenosylcobinamide-GDP ribazoletransferase